MKKYLFWILRILIFLIAFLFALWIFMPWREVGSSLMSFGHGILLRNGMRMNYSDVTGEADGFNVNNLSLEGMMNISFNSVRIRPKIIESVLSFGGVCDIEFTGCNILMGQKFNIGDGRLLLTAWPKEIFLGDLSTTGDIKINGYLSINLSNMKIGRADASLTVPENIASGFNVLKNFLPLEQDKNGQWYLRRK